MEYYLKIPLHQAEYFYTFMLIQVFHILIEKQISHSVCKENFISQLVLFCLLL